MIKNLYELYNLIEKVSTALPNVNQFVNSFDSLNREDTSYAAVVLQFRDGTQATEGSVRYRFYLGYVDRVNENTDTPSTSNNILIQSIAEENIRLIINKLYPEVDITFGNTFYPFTQRFTALTAGCYVELAITLAVKDCNYESGSVLRDVEIVSDSNGVKEVVPGSGVDGFKKVIVRTEVPLKEEVEKDIVITENGNTTYTPNEGEVFNRVSVDVNVPVGEKCLIGGPEWFNQIEKYSSLIIDSNVSAYVNNTPVIGYGEGIVPKIDSNGNQITDSNGNIVYEKFVPLYTNSYDSFYQNEPSQLYCVTESALDGKEFLYIRNHNTAKTLDFHNNEYYVEPIFFPIAISDYNTYQYSVWGADVKGLETNCITFWRFNGDGTHERPIELQTYSSQLFIAWFQESLCNDVKTEFGGWIKCTGGLNAFGISDRYAILNNPYNTEVSIIISSHYNSNLYNPGLPPFIKKINAVEVEDGSRIMLDGLFYGLQYLTSIPVCDFKNVVSTDNMFDNCTALTTLGGFTGLKVNLDLHYCSNLTKESLLNVFNEAADVTSSPKTLTLGATNLNKLTDEEKAIATNKGWTLA